MWKRSDEYEMGYEICEKEWCSVGSEKKEKKREKERNLLSTLSHSRSNALKEESIILKKNKIKIPPLPPCERVG